MLPARDRSYQARDWFTRGRGWRTCDSIVSSDAPCSAHTPSRAWGSISSSSASPRCAAPRGPARRPPAGGPYVASCLRPERSRQTVSRHGREGQSAVVARPRLTPGVRARSAGPGAPARGCGRSKGRTERRRAVTGCQSRDRHPPKQALAPHRHAPTSAFQLPPGGDG